MHLLGSVHRTFEATISAVQRLACVMTAVELYSQMHIFPCIYLAGGGSVRAKICCRCCNVKYCVHNLISAFNVLCLVVF